MSDLLDLLVRMERQEFRADVRAHRLPVEFAAKWMADEDPSALREPTDVNLAAAFQDCARPPRPDWYPKIRAAIKGAVQ